MTNSPLTFRRSIGRYRRRAVAVFALGLIAAVGIAANWPAPSHSEAPPAAPLAAAVDAPPPSQTEDESASQRAALAQHQVGLQSKLADMDGLLRKLETEQTVGAEKIASLTALLAEHSTAPAKLEPNSLSSSPPPDDLCQQLDALRLREHQLAAKMRDNHPQLQALRQQIADLQAGVPELPRQPSVQQSPTPSSQPLAAAMLAAERTRAEALAVERHSLLAAREGLRRQLDVLHSDLAALIAQPNRTPAEPSATHPASIAPPLAHKARPLPASSSTSQLSVRRAVVLLAGIFLAALLGLATAFVSATRNPILATPCQLESIWDLPLAGAIPPSLRLMPAAD